MASSDMYNIPPAQSDMNKPDMIPSDVAYAPSAPMPSGPPPLYSMSALPPPMSYAAAPSAHVAMYPTQPVFVTQMQVPYQGIVITGSIIPPQTVHIRDYMIWSIINIFLGGCLLGAIAVILSTQTKKRKQEGDAEGARTMSNLTLACNILITIIFFACTAFLIVYFVIILSSLS